MPLSLEEYKIAQLYMVARFSRERTTKGEGVEVVVSEPFENENGSGQYTKKIIHLGRFVICPHFVFGNLFFTFLNLKKNL